MQKISRCMNTWYCMPQKKNYSSFNLSLLHKMDLKLWWNDVIHCKAVHQSHPPSVGRVNRILPPTSVGYQPRTHPIYLWRMHRFPPGDRFPCVSFLLHLGQKNRFSFRPIRKWFKAHFLIGREKNQCGNSEYSFAHPFLKPIGASSSNYSLKKKWKKKLESMRLAPCV